MTDNSDKMLEKLTFGHVSQIVQRLSWFILDVCCGMVGSSNRNFPILSDRKPTKTVMGFEQEEYGALSVGFVG